MSYEKVDDILSDWADTQNLHLYKVYKDEEVRSFEVINADGIRCQLWVDAPDKAGQVMIHVWDYKKRRKDFISQKEELLQNLENAYQFINNWKSE